MTAATWLRLLLVPPMILLAGCVGSSRRPEPSIAPQWANDTSAGWDALTRVLPGVWHAPVGDGEGKTITVEYRLLSNGSALVETFTTSSGKQTLSAYHRDGRQLMVTHYCAQGNQARLKAVEAGADRVVFAYLDATNVGADDGVMHRLVVALHGDAFDQESVYRSGSGESDVSTLHFVREGARK